MRHKSEVAHETALAAATETTPHDATRVLWLLFASCDDGFFCHIIFSFLSFTLPLAFLHRNAKLRELLERLYAVP